MKLSDFDYSLSEELIAQYPAKVRGEDRMLVVNRKKRLIEERRFSNIIDYFEKDDLLILNNTRVIPARFFGRRKTGARVEIFIIDKMTRPFKALVRPSGRIEEGESIILDSGSEIRVGGKAGIGRVVEFDEPVDEVLEKYGHVPLPPYIRREDELSDRVSYQTVYATSEGATASPTAGLHFTREMLKRLSEKGIKIVYVTLHVSYGTFAPVKEEKVKKHKMHSEFYRIPNETTEAIKKARKRKARIFSCGTTALRALETLPKRTEGFTDLFIYPGYRFKTANALITNFHLPKSTLLLLTSAFCGKGLLFKAYRYAIERRFRFLSYGDAMLIL